MVAIAKFYLGFTVDESCGKCTPCRVGNRRLLEILTKITDGNGTMEDLEELKNLSAVIKDTALCGLGQTSPNPVLSTINNFWDEYVEHVTEKKCRAGQCQVQGLHGLRPGLPRQRHQRHPQEPARHQPAGLHQVRHLRREVQIRSNHR